MELHYALCKWTLDGSLNRALSVWNKRSDQRAIRYFMWQPDNVSEMFGTCYLVLFAHITWDRTKLICCLFVNALDVLASCHVSFRNHVSFSMTGVFLCTLHSSSLLCWKSSSQSTCQVSIKVNCWTHYKKTISCQHIAQLSRRLRLTPRNCFPLSFAENSQLKEKIKMWVTGVKIAQGERNSSHSGSQYILNGCSLEAKQSRSCSRVHAAFVSIPTFLWKIFT